MTISEDTRTRGRLLMVMCAGMFLVLLDVTAVNVALPGIGRSLHAQVSTLQWVVDGYAVAIAGLLLAAGTVGDRIGHRRVVLIGFCLFGAASLGCALAPNAAALIGSRVVQGIGAALLLPGTMALIAAAYPERTEQAKALGSWAAVSSLALPAGPVLGGLLVSASSWRMVFWINVPIVVLVVLAVLRLVSDRQGHRSGTFDRWGTTCFALALTAGVFTVIEIGRHAPAPLIVVAALMAMGAGTVGIAVEAHHPQPILPLDLLRRRRFLAPNVVALLMNLVFNGTLFVATLYLQEVGALSAAVAGICILPMAIPLVLLAPISGRLTASFGPRVPIGIGCGFGIVGAALLLTVQTGHGVGWIGIPIFVTGLGGGLVTAAVVTAAVRATPSDRAGLATGISNTARQTGTALGVAVFGAIAGTPALATAFVRNLHLLALIGAALWTLGLVLAVTSVAGRDH